MPRSMPYVFAEENTSVPNVNTDTWKLFIVDDDQDIHEITKIALKNLKFKDKAISFVSAYSAKEAIALLKEHSQFAIVLLDIGMETNDAGLEVASFIRQQLHNDITRIIIRTGQPGDVPEREIIETYDINDYKSKTELTIEKLFNAIRTAIAQYDQINELATLNTELEQRIQEALIKQKEQQDALFLQNRSIQMSELLSMIAHQWRQPLACISAVSSQLKLSLLLGTINTDEFDQGLSNIEQYTMELSETINEFRDIYEPTERKKSVKLLHLLQKSASVISNSFKEQHIAISIDCDETCKNHYVTSELYQVILNILKNSQEAFLEHSISPANIFIGVKSDEEKLFVTLEDTAKGIDENLIDKVFDPYFSTKLNKNGHGLGLYMSKHIVEQHCKGKLLVENTPRGVLFTLILPRL